MPKEADQLSGSAQENALTLLCFSDKYHSLVRSSVPVNLFSTFLYRDVVSRVHAYVDQYKKPPKAHLPDLVEDLLNGDDERGKNLKLLLRSIKALSRDFNEEWAVSQLTTFVSEQSLKIGMVEAYEAMERGDLDKAKRVMLESAKTQAQTFDRGYTLTDVYKDLLQGEEVNERVATGIRELDINGYGPTRKELLVIFAPFKHGKCIEANELVLLPNGARKRIEDVVKDKDSYVLAFDEVTGDIKPALVSEHWANGVKRCLRLTTKSGRSIITTPEHLYLTEHGWVRADKLLAGEDRIAIPLRIPGLGVEEESPHKLALLGYLIADGGLTGARSVSFSKWDSILRADFERCVNASGDSITWVGDGLTCYVVSSTGGKGKHGSNTIEWLKSIGLQGHHSRDKFVPDAVFRQTDEGIATFLRAIFSCDGSIYRMQIEYCSASYRLTQDLQHLLTRLGIFSRLRKFTARLNGKKFLGYGRLMIQGQVNVTRFLQMVGFLGRKAKSAHKTILNFKDRSERPGKGSTVKGKTPYGTRALSESAVFDLVHKVEEAGLRRTYDLTIQKYHTFIASDMVVHNTWMLIWMAKQALIQRWKVLYLTLEVDARIIGRRTLQSIWSLTKKDSAEVVMPSFDDNDGRLVGVSMTKYDKWASLARPSDLKALGAKLRDFRPSENMVIKQFPTGQLTHSKLVAYLDALETYERFVPDMIVIDMPKLMNYDARNLRIELGAEFERLRGVGVERNMAVVAAHQVNREGSQAKVANFGDVAEDISIVGTCDQALWYNQTPAEKELKLARLWVGAGRNDVSGYTVLLSQAYEIGQFCIESRMLTYDYWNLLNKDRNGDSEKEEA